MNWFRKKALKLLGGGVIHAHTKLIARKKELGPDGEYHYTDVRREVRDKVVTDAFVAFVVDQLQTETSAFGDFKYHDSGIGTGNEAAGDTGLGTPWGGARDVGTQTEGATANIYKSVATTTYNASKAITEHGLFNAASGVTLMDRTKFDALNVVDTNQIEWTFSISFASGG